MNRGLHIDLRVLAAAGLAAVAALVVLAATSPPARTEVLVAAAPLADRVPLASLEVTIRGVEDPTGLVPAADASRLEGYSLAAPLEEGSPIPSSLLVAPEALQPPDMMGLDLPAAQAVQGEVAAGDRVDVYHAGEEPGLVAADVPVIAAELDSASLGSGQVHLLVAVAGDLALELITAAESGSIYLVRSGA